MTSPPNDPDKARRKLILDAFDAALDQPEGERAAWLRQTYHDDAQLVAAVEALLTADAMAPSAMPTELDEGGETTLLVPPARIGAYQLVSKLGGGGMGEVWLGLRDDGLFEHEVAIKLMRPSRIASAALAFFNTERRALARLRHHHIARLFDGGVTPEGLPWIIMERIEGDTLDGWMRATKPAEAEAVRVMIAVAEAVQYAHQQLVVHADLKPSNILVDSTGEPSLVDFGISSLALPEKADDAPGVRPRTPAYASPERLAGHTPTPADDIYALGLLLRGLLTHHWPEENGGAALTGDLAAIAGRATARDPEARYATAQAFADDLKAYAGRRPVKARGGDWRYESGLFVRRHPWSTSAAAGGLLALLAALALITTLYVRAETRFTEVRQLAGYMLGDQYDALERLPGASALRARTADVGRDYLERLSKVPGASPDVARDVAIGYGRVGHALATTSTNATGDAEAGEKALAASEADLRALLKRYPDRDDIKRELARTLAWKSGVLSSAHNDAEGAYAAVDEALALYGEVLKRHPGDIDAAYGRWNAEVGRADVLAGDSRNTDVAALMTQALAEGRDLPANGNYAALKPLLTAASDNALGDAVYDEARPEPAIVHYTDAVTTLENARAAGVLDIRILIRLTYYDYQVAASYQGIKRPEEALVWIDKGVSLIDDVSRYDDSDVTLRISGLLNLTRAGILSDLGRVPEAMAAAEKPVAMKRAVARLHPGDADAQFALADALHVYGDDLDTWKRPAAACAAFREAKAIWDGQQNVPQRLQKAEVEVVDARLKSCP